MCFFKCVDLTKTTREKSIVVPYLKVSRRSLAKVEIAASIVLGDGEMVRMRDRQTQRFGHTVSERERQKEKATHGETEVQ